MAILILPTTVAFAKGGGGGGRGGSFGGSRSSSYSRSTTTTPKSTPVKTTTPKAPSAPRVKSTPSKATPKITSTTNKTVNGKNYGKKGSVVGSDYQPKFSGGYTPAAGSVVYYQQSSALDWLPFYMIMSSQNAHREAVVVEPGKDGGPATEKVVKEEGLDGMYVWNWIFSILVSLGLIALIVWYVNKKSKQKYA